MAFDPEKTLASTEKQVKSGRIREARTELAALAGKRVPRRLLVRAAYLARRTLQPNVALLLLARLRDEHSDAEKAEYGMALVEAGAILEGIRVLSSLDPAKFPHTVGPMALAHFRQWDWLTPLPTLERIAKRNDGAEQDRLKCRLYYGIALVHGKRDHEQAHVTLSNLKKEAVERNYPLIELNAAYMLMQNAFLQKQWKEALAIIRHHEKNRPEVTGPQYAPYHRMWSALVRLHAEGDAGREARLKELNAIRADLQATGNWIFVRNIDVYVASLLQDKRMLMHLYFGTPFSGARRTVRERFGLKISDLPGHYDWLPGRAPGARGPIEGFLSVCNGANSLNGEMLKAGQVPQRLLESLASELYRPSPSVELHELIYPDQYYNPASSPVQLRQAIFRLRQWLRATKLPIEVKEDHEKYRLDAEPGWAIRIIRPDEPHEASTGVTHESAGAHARLRELTARVRDRFADADLTSMELAAELGVSRNSAINWLREAVEAGLVERTGGGRATRYRLKPPRPPGATEN